MKKARFKLKTDNHLTKKPHLNRHGRDVLHENSVEGMGQRYVVGGAQGTPTQLLELEPRRSPPPSPHLGTSLPLRASADPSCFTKALPRSLQSKT